MKRIVSVSIYFYDLMLCLYPVQFRADYADEMRDLPVSVLREHWRERQNQPVWDYQESGFMRRLYSPRLLRFCAVTILVLSGLYGLSVVSAYFAFDMHLHSLQNSQEWWYTIANNPTFIGNHLPIELFVLLLFLITPPSIILFGGTLGLNVLGRWQGLNLYERRMALLALGAGLLVLISLNTPIVYIGGLWFYD